MAEPDDIAASTDEAAESVPTPEANAGDAFARRMYPEMPVDQETPTKAEPGEKPLQDEGGFLPDDATGYTAAIDTQFEEVRRHVYEHSPDEHRTVLTARVETAATLHEMGAYRDEARALGSLLLENWNTADISEPEFDAQLERMEALLRKEWGDNAEENYAFALAAEDAAAKRLPWLTPLLNRRPSAEIVRQLARIGRRMHGRSSKQGGLGGDGPAKTGR